MPLVCIDDTLFVYDNKLVTSWPESLTATVAAGLTISTGCGCTGETAWDSIVTNQPPDTYVLDRHADNPCLFCYESGATDFEVDFYTLAGCNGTVWKHWDLSYRVTAYMGPVSSQRGLFLWAEEATTGTQLRIGTYVSTSATCDALTWSGSLADPNSLIWDCDANSVQTRSRHPCASGSSSFTLEAN